MRTKRNNLVARFVGALWVLACAVIAVMVWVGGPSVAYADPGDLDTTFSGDGKQTTDFSGPLAEDKANAVTIQADGKIVAAGINDRSGVVAYSDFALARYNTNGTLDNNLDGDGKVTTDFSGFRDWASAVAILPDGKILAAGTAETIGSFYDFGLVRYNPDGSLDTTFDGDGRVTTDFGGSEDYILSMAVLTDGKIVAVGYTYTSVSVIAIARYNSNGSLDTSFDGDGKVTTDLGSGIDIAYDVAIQSDGKIIAVGSTGLSPTRDFVLVRYNVGGSLDTTFSFDGIVTTDWSGDNDTAKAVILHPNGKIIVAGQITTAMLDLDFGLARYHPDGLLDNSFGGNGRITTNFGGGDYAYDLALQSINEDKIVAVGKSQIDYFAVAQYDGHGALDPTFSGDGKVLTPFTGIVSAYSVAIQTNGKIVAAGEAAWDFALARYLGDDPATPTPTSTNTPSGPTATATGTPTNTPDPNATATPTSTACPIHFADIPLNHPFHAYARCLACRGIISGYPCGGPGEPCNANNDPYFRVGRPVTRGQIAKVVALAAGFTEPVAGQTFEDVLPGSTFYEPVERLASRGVMSGYPCGIMLPCVPPNNRPYFLPGTQSSRAQISKMVSNAAGFFDPPVGQTFEDVPPAADFYEYAQRLAMRGVIGGYLCGGPGEPCVPPDNRAYFRPGNAVTRVQTTKIVANAFYPNCYTPARIDSKK